MWLYIVLAAVCAAAAVWALYYGMVYRFYIVSTDKLRHCVRIAHISDLHSIFHGKNQSRLMKKLDAQRPDAVMLTGDIFDRKNSPDGAVSFLKQVSKYPCFFVTGNHEYGLEDVRERLEWMKSLGIRVLEERSEELCIGAEKINVSGVSDAVRTELADESYNFHDAMKALSSGLDSRKFNILLSHNNSYVDEYKKYKFDLVLSGHAHGGQFRIPYIMNGFFVRKQGFFPKYAGGMYTYDTLVHIVSRGISNNPRWCPRIFNPTELVVIDICPSK